MIILTNICIALLNNTMARIQNEKQKVWKYARTKFWMRLINEKSLPPPFNLISLLISPINKFVGLGKVRISPGYPESVELNNSGGAPQETDQLE